MRTIEQIRDEYDTLTDDEFKGEADVRRYTISMLEPSLWREALVDEIAEIQKIKLENALRRARRAERG